MSISDPSQATEMFNTVVNGNGQITSLSEATKGRFLISEDVSVLQTLLKFAGFTELRVRCFKPWHGRTFHGIFKGESLMKKMFQLESTSGLCSSNGNKEIRMMADDNSLFRESTCENLHIGYGTNPPFYRFMLFVFATAHVSLYNMECDDWTNNDGFTTSGDWQFYVR